MQATQNNLSVLLTKANHLIYNEDSILNDQNHIVNRIANATIPYFNFYGPFNQCSTLLSQGLLVATSAKKGFTDFTALVQSYRTNGRALTLELCKAATIVALEIISTIVSIAYYRLGMLYSTSLDVATHLNQARVYLQDRNFREANKAFFESFTSGLRLASLLSPSGLELLIASTVTQIILEIGKSYKEWQGDRYIECLSNLGLAVIRSYQLSPQLKLLNKKWFPIPSSEVTLELKPDSLKTDNIQEEKTTKRRAAIDVGSGGTKVFIADVDTKTNKIVNIVYENSFSVSYQAALEKSTNQSFDQTIQEKGLQTFKEIKHCLDNYQVDGVYAIATEAFRKADNGITFAKCVQTETGIPLQIIPQQQEGVIAFNSALAVNSSDKQNTIVWDIGTGSFQITGQNTEGNYQVFTGGMGSVPFKNHIIEAIQGKDSGQTITPNPISEKEYKEAGRYARKLAKKASREFKAKIKSEEVTIIGIGRLFYNSIRPLVTESNTIERKGLRNFIRASLEKSDLEINNPYAHVDIPNCIQVLEVMKALHIQEISAVNTTTTKGMIISADESFSDWN